MAGQTLKGLTKIDGTLMSRVKRISDADSPYTVLDTDFLLECNTADGAITINLPTLANSKKNGMARELWFKQVAGTNSATLDGSGAEQIDGAATHVMSADNDCIGIRAGTSDWLILSQPTKLGAADIADDALDSQHYGPTSIDTEHLAAGVISADAPGRALLAAGVFDSATASSAFAADSIASSKVALVLPITIALPFTLGNRAGPNADGVMVGSLTHTAFADVTQEDNSGTSFVDETADAAEATANDVAIPDPFDTNDALYVVHSARYCAVVVKVGTAGAGDAVAAEVAVEYSQGGDAWASLEDAADRFTDDSTAFTAGTSTYVISFIPPSDWATQAVDGGTAGYAVRFRATADDVYNTTQPLLSQLWAVPLNAGQGIVVPATGTITAVDLQALTPSGTTADTVLLLVNITQGTHAAITWTKADPIDRTTGLTLAVTAGDELALVVCAEDGTTEFASGQMVLSQTL